MKLYRSQTITPEAYADAVASLHATLDAQQQGALYHYTEVGYDSLNDDLNAGRELNPVDAAMAQQLDAIIASNTHSVPLLYRGAKRIYGPVIEGEVCPFPAFTSATSDPQQVLKFITPERPILFEIETAAGCPISLHRDEFEYLLPRRQEFFVKKITENVQWHAEFGTSGYTRSVQNATVIEMVEV